MDHKLFGDGPEHSDADGEQQPESLLKPVISLTLEIPLARFGTLRMSTSLLVQNKP